MQKDKIQSIHQKNYKIVNQKKLEAQLDRLLEGQEVNQELLYRGFLGLAQQNQELIEVNKGLTQQLKQVLQEFNQMKEEREEKEIRKQAWSNRKRLPKRDPMTSEIYHQLIKAAEGPTYLNVRLRIALCILAVTGIRINELLPLRVSQLSTLIQESWIAIDRSKRGPSSHRAFLTKEGKKILQDRQKDFQLIFLMKESDSYLFTSESDHSQMIRRETITRDVNKLTHLVSNQLPGKPNITSHSFRIGYITQLWKDSKDIEFVKQSIGHRKLDTTSQYVRNLSDQERQNRINQI